MNTQKKSKKDIILVVDDQPNNLKVISSVLGESYSLSFANNGVNALKILDGLTPDLVLLDVMMPEMDGYEVCQHIKSNEKTKDIPVIFLTAKTDIEDIIKAFNAGAVDYITKPFNIMELKVRVSNHINLKHAHSELEEANKKLIKLNHEKDKFFTIIAHDLRNPFIGITSLSKIMLDQLKSNDFENMEEYVQEINNASKNAYNLLKNLLNWARSQTGRMEFTPTLLSVFSLLDETVNLLKESASLKGINLINTLPDDIEIVGDKEMLSVVFRNIISNAIKFTKTGGTIRIEAVQNESELTIQVIDSGIGMTPKMIEDIFKIDKSSGRKGTNGEPSTGLGLLLCKEFIEKHDGSIAVTSEVNIGSVFTISLPLIMT